MDLRGFRSYTHLSFWVCQLAFISHPQDLNRHQMGDGLNTWNILSFPSSHWAKTGHSLIVLYTNKKLNLREKEQIPYKESGRYRGNYGLLNQSNKD